MTFNKRKCTYNKVCEKMNANSVYNYGIITRISLKALCSSILQKIDLIAIYSQKYIYLSN